MKVLMAVWLASVFLSPAFPWLVLVTFGLPVVVYLAVKDE